MSININYSDGEYYVSQYLASLGISFGTAYLAKIDATLPSSMRWRSRGRHDPGSGDYSCTIVTYPGGVNGCRIGDDVYITHLPLTVIENGRNYQIRSWDGVFWEQTTVYHGAWGWYDANHFTEVNYARYQFNRVSGRFTYFDGWRGYRRFEGSWLDPLKARFEVAMDATFYTDTASWARQRTAESLSPLIPLKKDETYLHDSVETQPNWACHLNSAYIKAFESFPAITTNNIQNLVSVFGALAKLVTGGVGHLDSLGTIQDAWLGYRYAYSTTKSDINELVSYVDRMRTFTKLSGVRGRGQYRVESENGVWEIRCSIECTSSDYTQIYSDIERLGLALDGYNTWDMIPYSFIVDWFLRIGDLLEVARTRNYAVRLTPSAVWFSVHHEFVNSSGCKQSDYYRFRATDLSFLAGLPSSYLSTSSKSKTTWVKRGADAISLLT